MLTDQTHNIDLLPESLCSLARLVIRLKTTSAHLPDIDQFLLMILLLAFYLHCRNATMIIYSYATEALPDNELCHLSEKH